MTFVSIGVALDGHPDAGITWLEELGNFDELSSGQRWLNSHAIELFWKDGHSLASTPQVIIETRHVRVGKTRITVGLPVVTLRMIGASEIMSMSGIRDLDSLLAIDAGGKS